MAFNSLTFLVFFALVLLVYQLPIGWTARKFLLLAASYGIYAAWNAPFVVLLMLAAGVDFVFAGLLGRIERRALRKIILACSLTFNLGLLGYFKYSNFLLESFVAGLGGLGIAYRPARLSIIVPLGISFYTFETVSYLIDVYRRKIPPWGSFLDYALFLTFFPHLVAGPIVRAPDFLPQCRTPRRSTSDQMGWGLALLVFGLFEKMVLADGLLGPVVDRIVGRPFDAGIVDAWVGAIGFTCQVFFDFAGYSSCAIGTALCFGFVLKDNFRFPLAAVGFSDFWRRWHISLSTWMHDYVFVPLGGDGHGTLRTYVNVMITMVLVGLWHGPSWKYVAWGGLHGLLLIGERRFGTRRVRSLRGTAALVALLRTQVLLWFTMILFRAPDFRSAFHLQTTMLGLHRWWASPDIVGSRDMAGVLGVMACTIVCHWMLRDSSLEHAAGRLPSWGRGVILGAIITMLAAFWGASDNHAFIYFQF